MSSAQQVEFGVQFVLYEMARGVKIGIGEAFAVLFHFPGTKIAEIRRDSHKEGGYPEKGTLGLGSPFYSADCDSPIIPPNLEVVSSILLTRRSLGLILPHAYCKGQNSNEQSLGPAQGRAIPGTCSTWSYLTPVFGVARPRSRTT